MSRERNVQLRTEIYLVHQHFLLINRFNLIPNYFYVSVKPSSRKKTYPLTRRFYLIADQYIYQYSVLRVRASNTIQRRNTLVLRHDYKEAINERCYRCPVRLFPDISCSYLGHAGHRSIDNPRARLRFPTILTSGRSIVLHVNYL